VTKTILVAGGAGYVGSHACLALAENGFTPIVFDNFSNGHKDFVQWGSYVEGDIRDKDALKAAFDLYEPIGVMHFAALIEVGFSVQNPAAFYDNNVCGSINLINAAMDAGTKAFVFSSTCATYGEPHYSPIDEMHPQNPINPYGNTKLIVEKYLSDLQTYCGFQSIPLRYFNAAGADAEGRIGEKHDPETHAIPIAIEAAMGKRDGFKVFGSDYDTRDGSCIRDYIHVTDLADAHLKALNYLLDGNPGRPFNLGTGTGTSVIELVNNIKKVANQKFKVTMASPRSGDSPALVAENSNASAGLGWKPRRDLNTIITDAWNWHEKILPS